MEIFSLQDLKKTITKSLHLQSMLTLCNTMFLSLEINSKVNKTNWHIWLIIIYKCLEFVHTDHSIFYNERKLFFIQYTNVCRALFWMIERLTRSNNIASLLVYMLLYILYILFYLYITDFNSTLPRCMLAS